jgi:hypothetical protein
MVAFALLQRIKNKNPDLEHGDHCPKSMLKHVRGEARFIIFLTMTLVAVMLLQNSITDIITNHTFSMFPDSKWSRSILQLVWALLLTPIIILLAIF